MHTMQVQPGRCLGCLVVVAIMQLLTLSSSLTAAVDTSPKPDASSSGRAFSEMLPAVDPLKSE